MTQKSEDTPVNTDRLRAINPKPRMKDKIIHKRKVMEKKQHKVVIIGDGHARGCTAEVKHLLNNKFEVLGFANSGSGVEFIEDASGVNLQQLTRNDVVVVLEGGAQMILQEITQQWT